MDCSLLERAGDDADVLSSTITVAWKDAQQATFECRPSENVLHAGLRHGIGLPYECATGTCGTCKATLVAGEVEEAWADAPGGQGVRRDKGELLLCQTRARSDCRFGVSQRPRPGADASPAHGTGRVRRSGRLTHDVILMQLGLDRPLSFRAGQFLLLAAPAVPGFRAYSIVNPPNGGAAIELIAKRKPAGGLSEILFSSTLHEVPLRVFGPLGRAVFDPLRGGDLLLVAGGTGLAGPMSILESAAAAGYFAAHRAALYFGVRTAADLFFLDRLSSLKQRHSEAIEITVALSDEPVPSALPRAFPELAFVAGLVHEAIGSNPPRGLATPSAYLAGPPLAVDAATRIVLRSIQVPPSRIHFDRFG